MREQIPIYVDFKTSFEDVQLLRSEMTKFVNDSENNRDYFPEVDIQVLGLAEMNKLELQVEILHKSNWANEAVRASRRSKFLCALVLALRRVPINGPGGGGAALGDSTNPSYSVAISDSTAAQNKSKDTAEKEAARLVPSKKLDAKSDDKNAGHALERKAVNVLTDRSPAIDNTRDDPSTSRDPDRAQGESTDLEEVRTILRRETTQGRRKSAHHRSMQSLRSVQRSPSAKSARSFRSQIGGDTTRPPVPPESTRPPMPLTSGAGVPLSPGPGSAHGQKRSDESAKALPQIPPMNYQLPQHQR